MNRIAFGLIVATFGVVAQAAPFQNGSFEIGKATNTNMFDIPVGSTAIPGWVVVQGNVDWEGAPPIGWQPSDGGNSIDLVGTQAVGGVAQTFDTVPGITYQVTFDLAGNYGAPPTVKPLTVTVDGVTQNYTFDTTGRGQFNMGWATHSFTFTATSTSATISFVSDTRPGGFNAGAVLDNVRIVPLGGAASASPIPIDWAQWAAALGVLAAAGIVLRRRR